MKVSSSLLLVSISSSLLQHVSALPFWLNCFIFRRFIIPRIPSKYNFGCQSCGIGEWQGLFGGGFSTELDCSVDYDDGFGLLLDAKGTVELLGRRKGVAKGTGGWSVNNGEFFSGDVEIRFEVNIRDRSLMWTGCSIDPDDSCFQGCYCVYEGISFPDIPEFYCETSCPI